jgi:hypothetical protein
MNRKAQNVISNFFIRTERYMNEICKSAIFGYSLHIKLNLLIDKRHNEF